MAVFQANVLNRGSGMDFVLGALSAVFSMVIGIVCVVTAMRGRGR